MKIKIYSVIAAVLSGIAVGGKFLSDYGCDLECNQGDVVYEIEAVVDRIRIPGNFSEFYCEECHEQRPFKGVSEVYANVRTFRATNNTKQSKFCEMMDGYDGVKGITGPCLQVLPGQTMSIKLINNMHDAMEELDTHIPSRKEWWESAGRPKPLKKMHPEKETTENIPGWAFDGTVFDTTNLHFHGLKIVPHLFYPLGTNEPTAPWISVLPSGTKNRCFCYNIAIAKDQSTGTFLYHVHRHGSTSMQLWSGMLGLIQVGSYSLKNSLDHELRNKIAQDIPFPIWGPSFRFEGTASRFKSKGNIDGSKSLKGSKTANVELNSWHNNGEAATIVPVLVGNEYVPTFQFKQGDVVRFRVVCIFVTMFCGFSIVDESNMDTRMKLYIIASDGISLEGMRETNHIILSSAQRLDVLVQLKDAGRFKIISDGVFVFTEPMPNPDTVLAYISVSPRPRPIPEKNIMSWRFKQSQPEMPSTIVQRRTIRFETDDDDKFMMPNELPQINGKSYREIVINTDVIHGTSEEWILEAPNDIHTYHMHVVPFYIKSIMTDDTEMMNNPAIRKAIIDDQLNMWRDVVMIPPKGNATILVRFDGHHPDDYSAFTGKTVYHCHLEDDADMGMMQNINILPSK